MPILSGSWLTGYILTALTKRSSLVCGTASSTALSSLRISSSKTRRMNNTTASSFISKPPNVLIYTGKKDESEFEFVTAQLHKVLRRDSYTIYQLDDHKVLGHPWSKNSILLVIYSDENIEDKILNEFKLYLKDGGNVLNVGRGCKGLLCGVELKPMHFDSTKPCIIDVKTDSLDVQDNALEVECKPFYFTGFDDKETDILASEKENKSPVMVYSKDQCSRLVLSAVNIFHEKIQARQLLTAVLKKLDMKCASNELPQLTPAYLFASEKDKLQLMECLKPHLSDGICKGQKISLEFFDGATELDTVKVTEDQLPVMVDHNYDDTVTNRFDWKTYSQHLSTHTLGRLVLYTDVVQSTQTLLEGNQTFIHNIPKHTGVVAVTSHQLKGKGRGGNAWLSPAGCMMFSIVVQVKFASELGSRLPYIQHIASLALIQAVKCIPGYENINICLKWPNDIYYGRNVKIGGVVISSTAMGNRLNAVIGMGVNISNKEPTICINEIIKQYNNDNGTELAPLQLEMVLARTINYMEELIDEFQVDTFLSKYYQHWMHSGCKVTLNTGSSPQQVTIVGLDDFGFLVVKKDSGETISLQPDGNTFDILANLIEIKT